MVLSMRYTAWETVRVLRSIMAFGAGLQMLPKLYHV